MTILLNILHTPWQFMLATAFPEVQFHATDWNLTFREVPANVRVVTGEEFLDHQYDLVIYDNHHTAPVWKLLAIRSVFVLHCEQDLDVEANREHIARVFSECDHIVSVGEHKLWTLREWASHPKSVVIRHAVFDLPPGEPIKGLIGTSHNAMSTEHITVWNDVQAGFPSLAIGHVNNAGPWPKAMPFGYDAYLTELRKLDVYINIVSGDSFGLAPLDAMSLGIPVITGLSRDIPAPFISGWNCMVTNTRACWSQPTMRHWAKLLTEDRDLRNRIGTEGRKAALDFYSLDLFVSNWTRIFDEAGTGHLPFP